MVTKYSNYPEVKIKVSSAFQNADIYGTVVVEGFASMVSGVWAASFRKSGFELG